MEIRQQDYFSKADEKHFYWFAYNPYIAEREKDLLREINKENVSLACEVGCGEGFNIVNLRRMGFKGKIVGVDFSPPKVEFCKKEIIDNADFAVGDGACLPFKNDTFDLVFCKSLLHHVADKNNVISELIRVCRPKNKIIILEGNGSNPMNIFFRILSPQETGMKNSRPDILYSLFKENRQCEILDFKMLEPCNLFRVILHYKWGLPYLSRFTAVKKILGIFDSLAYRFILRRYWAYMVVTLKKIV